MTDTIQSTVEPILNTVDSAVTSQLNDPGPVTELMLAVAVVVLVITFHGWCLGRISRFFGERFERFDRETSAWRVNALMGVTVALLAGTHLLETLIWAYPIFHLRLVESFRDAYTYTLEAYTTLGEGGLALPPTWTLLGPVIAISGLFTFSWTGSVLVYVMSEISKLRAKEPRPTGRNPET